MNEQLEQLLSDLARWPELSTADRSHLASNVFTLSILRADDARQLIEGLLDWSQLRDADDADDASHRDNIAAGGLLALAEFSRSKSAAPHGREGLRALNGRRLEQLVALYRRSPAAWRARPLVLALLATLATSAALAQLAELLVTDPPAGSSDIALALVPLFRAADFDPEPLFPRLLDALANPATACLVLDVANFATRKGLVAQHPAAARKAELAVLLGGLIQKLYDIEAAPPRDVETQARLRETVNEAVSLCIALCDALALIGDDSVTGKLYQGLELRHRRLRAETAFALARLGDKTGVERLVELAADPAARTRALDCLEELNELRAVAAEQRSPAARAAAQLADWLGEATQFGAPPAVVELIEARRWYWPGYQEPIDAWLFDYEYHFGEREYIGVGIVGPLTHSFSADLDYLPPADIFALFAGWQAQHAEIVETPASELSADQRGMAAAMLQTQAAFHHHLQLVKLGGFFGELIAVATAERGNESSAPEPGTLIVDDRQAEWYPIDNRLRPVGPDEAYWIHKGRKLLKSFNPNGAMEIEGDAGGEDALS